MSNKNLLPVGFYDLIFEEAEKSYRDSNLAITHLINSGYRLIKPPLIEFDESYYASKESDYFVTIDSVSDCKIALRSDITMQIRRILATRLKNSQMPLRLCYVGDVIKARSEDLYADRQQTQIGFEIIGEEKEVGDFEIINYLINILKKIKVEDFSFNFTLPNFLDIILEGFEIEKKSDLKKAIFHKNLSKIAELSGSYSEILQKIVRFNDLSEILKSLKSDKISSVKISQELSRVENIGSFFENNFPQIKLNFDLFGNNNCGYHQDIYFEVFVKNFSYAIAKGGSYEIFDGDRNIVATGSTIYMNNLRKI